MFDPALWEALRWLFFSVTGIALAALFVSLRREYSDEFVVTHPTSTLTPEDDTRPAGDSIIVTSIHHFD